MALKDAELRSTFSRTACPLVRHKKKKTLALSAPAFIFESLAFTFCLDLLPRGQIHKPHTRPNLSHQLPLYPVLPPLNRTPNLDIRVAIIVLRVLNVPHHTVLVLQFGVRDERGRGRGYP